MEKYVLVTTILFLCLGTAWNSKDLLNAMLKTTMICLCIWGALLLAHAHGIIHLR